VLQADQARLVQQQQGAAAIGGVVGDGDGGPVGDIVQRGQLAGIDAERLDVHASDTGQVGTTALVELVEIGLVLEEVGIQTAFGDLQVGLYIVGEDLDIQIDTL